MKLINRIRNIHKAALILVILVLLTGCWDRQEIEERAVVLGIGIDQAGPGAEQQEEQISHSGKELPAPSSDMIRVTLHIAVPGRIPLGPSSGGGGAGGGGGIKTVWVVDGVGHTIDDAMNSLQQRVAPPLFFGHLRVILLSEDVAKKGIQNLNDYLRRNPEVRRMNWMLVCRGKASEIMHASPQLERVPTLYLMTQMDQAVKMGRMPNDFLGIFWSSSSAKGKEGYLPYVTFKGENSIEVDGLALFKGNKLVGSTTPLEIPLYMGVMGMNPAGGQAYVQIPGTQEFMEFSGRNRKSSIRVRIVDGRPHISVNIKIDGNLREKSKDIVPLSTEVINQMEQSLANNVKKGYMDLIHKTQEQSSDIFGFGEYVRAKEPKYWNEQIKTKEAWQQAYKDLDVELSVQLQLRRIGMKAT